MQPASATRDDANLSIGSEELAEGLMLVRASILKIIRLQLAMERRDRRGAIEAVDDLVALDRSLEEFLTQVPIANDDGLFRNVLEMERSALNVEKHTLAAGISNRTWESTEPEPSPEVATDWVYDAKDDEGPQSRWLVWCFVILASFAFAASAFLLGASGHVPNFIREII